MNNLKEKKINYYIRKAKEYLNNKSYSSTKSYIDKAYNTAYNYGKPTSYITDYRKIIYNAESDYYNSEGKKCFDKKDYNTALNFYNKALNCLSNYRDSSLETNIRQNIKEVENTKKNLEADKLYSEGLDKFKEKNVSNYDIIKTKFTSAYNDVVDEELKKVIKKDLDKLDIWKLNLRLENIKKNIESNEPQKLEDSHEKLRTHFKGINNQESPYN